MDFEHILISITVWLDTQIETASERQRKNNRIWELICLEAWLPDMLTLATLVHFVLPVKLLSGKLKH